MPNPPQPTPPAGIDPPAGSALTFGSLFSGIGGFDLGFSRASMVCRWQIESGKRQQKVLEERWPDVKRYSDIRRFAEYDLVPVTVICGGDPCPIRSNARSNGASNSPDLAGYFLAVAGRLRPEWVVRENVPAPDDCHFDAVLAALGYGTVIIRMDAAEVTGQSRQRDFIIGRYQATRESLIRIFSHTDDGQGAYTTRLETRQIAPALTTHRTRYDSRDCYIYENGRLRILDGDEREALAGFPAGYTAGFSEAARATFYGNAVVPGLAEWIGRRIIAASEGERCK